MAVEVTAIHFDLIIVVILKCLLIRFLHISIYFLSF